MNVCTRIAAVAVLALAPPAAGADGPAPTEYQVKAAFLFNFLKFVEWPNDNLQAPYVVGVMGRDPFGEILEHTIRGKTVNGRSVVVRRFSRPPQARECHVLFLPRQEAARVGNVPAGVLTVGEVQGFLSDGGLINFFLVDGHVFFEIHADAARAAGLRVNAMLLKLGRRL